MIKLNKITLNNFKVFGGEPYTISFEDNSLVLFAGPNGYGKTSVFDAIELALTGNISRLVPLENRQNPADIVVAYQGEGPVEVIIEFKDKDSNIKIFQRKLKNQIPNAAKKIGRFKELWDFNEVVNGVLVPAHQDALEQYFCSKDFSRDFLLFHYVQQEETSGFLKSNNEEQRANELAKLFGNTREADEKLSKLQGFYRDVGKSRRSVIGRIEDIMRRHKIDDNTSLETGANEPHAYALPWLTEVNKSPFWDVITVSELDEKKLNSALSEINNIKSFLEHQRYFLRSNRFENAIRQREILELYVGYFNSINDHDLHVARNTTLQLIKQTHATLKNGDVKLVRAIVNIDTIFQELKLGSSVAFEAALQSLIKEEDKAIGLSSIYSELIKHHAVMYTERKRPVNPS